MLWSKSLIPTLKEDPQEAESVSHKLLLRAGLVRMLMAGVYSYLPLGLKVLNNIEAVIRQEMNACGGSELLLPALQPKELWTASGREKDMGEVMIRFTDRRGRNLCLGPTHEEVITDLVKKHISSYKQLPLLLFQIQTKFRDEIRPRFGVVRACEFVMKDAYSFDQDEAGLDKNYKAMHKAYNNIFKRCGLDVLTIEADPGVMGGKVSHEFMVPAASGEDIVLSCSKCRIAKAYEQDLKTAACPKCASPLEKQNCVEVGHIFKLGTKYSKALGACFLDAKGKEQPVIMGCYGIGVSRMIAAVIEQNNDAEGIIWPKEVSPYKVEVLPLNVNDEKILKAARDLYQELSSHGVEALLDDRDLRPGVKFKDADLIGIPVVLVIGEKSLKEGKVELKTRRDKKTELIERKSILERIKNI
ncbi:proline--tRNA ligase [Candidatus Omnitrophota bacterium]